MSLTVGEARRLVTGLLTRSGLPSERARSTADALVLADCWGIGSHGLMRVPSYLARLEAGGYAADAELVTVRDHGPLVVLDGQAGIGHWQVQEAARLGVQRCAGAGVALVAVANSGHCGALGVHTLPALDAGLVAVVLSHGPPAMPAWGGSEPLLSTSPLAAGIPCRPHPAIVDLATSAVARGKVAEYAARGEPLPPGWAFSPDGTPTTDPAQALAGMLAPLGGAKGFAVAFLVEALTAGLVGPRLSVDVPDPFSVPRAGDPQRIAHLVLTLDPDALSGDGSAAGRLRLDALAERVAAGGGRAPGSRRRMPGEIDEGETLPVAETAERALGEWAGRLGLDHRGHDP